MISFRLVPDHPAAMINVRTFGHSSAVAMYGCRITSDHAFPQRIRYDSQRAAHMMAHEELKEEG